MAEENTKMKIDYGPLAGLIGTWKGDKGIDLSPEPDGQEENTYHETITFQDIGDVTNAETQVLTILHYRQIVQRKSNNEIFHDETGYWMWDAAAGIVMHSLVIPRAVAVLAGGKYLGEAEGNGDVVLEVGAKLGDPDWGILQSPFMRDKARTTAFRHKITLGKGTLRYAETTMLEIYGKTFEHTDQNELTRQS